MLERQASRTPDSVQSVICLGDCRQRLRCEVLPRIGISAATGISSARARANPTRLAPSWTFTQPPQSPATLVGFYPTVSSLTSTQGGGRFVFCCSCRQPPLLLPCRRRGRQGGSRPHLLFREATVPDLHRTGSREVPLAQSRTSDGPLACQSQ